MVLGYSHTMKNQCIIKTHTTTIHSLASLLLKYGVRDVCIFKINHCLLLVYNPKNITTPRKVLLNIGLFFLHSTHSLIYCAQFATKCLEENKKDRNWYIARTLL